MLGFTRFPFGAKWSEMSPGYNRQSDRQIPLAPYDCNLPRIATNEPFRILLSLIFSASVVQSAKTAKPGALHGSIINLHCPSRLTTFCTFPATSRTAPTTNGNGDLTRGIYLRILLVFSSLYSCVFLPLF